MAISLVNWSGGGQQGGPFATVVSAAQNIAPGNTIVVGIRWSASLVTDNAGNTYVPLPHLVGNPVSNLGEGFHFWYCNNCVGNSALVVTATLVSTSVALDTYTVISVWNIAGGPLVLDQYTIGTGSGTTMTYPSLSTRYPNTIACLIGMSTANLNTNTANAPLILDSGNINSQQIAGASHVINTTMVSGQSLSMVTSVNGNWQIGGPVFGAQPQQIPTRSRRRAAEAAVPPMFTGRMYNYYITLERLF